MSEFSDCNRDRNCMLIKKIGRQEAERLKRWLEHLEPQQVVNIEKAEQDWQTALKEIRGRLAELEEQR